jgi:hypothetical protein
MTRSLFLRKFNLTTNVRRLGRWLLDKLGPPPWAPAVPTRQQGPIDDAEFAFLSALANDHEELHTIEMATEGKPPPRRCESYGRACRAFGVARALRVGLDGIANIRGRRLLRDVAGSVADAAVALAEVDRTLARYCGESDAGLARSHGRAVTYMHDHQHACVLPATLRAPIRELRASLRTFCALGLGPAIAAHREKTARPGRKRRPPVLALMEEALSDEGFTHREVVALIDDGYGGSTVQRVDRMRKAVTAERLWRSMSAAQRKAALGESPAPDTAAPESATTDDSEPRTDTATGISRSAK